MKTFNILNFGLSCLLITSVTGHASDIDFKAEAFKSNEAGKVTFKNSHVPYKKWMSSTGMVFPLDPAPVLNAKIAGKANPAATPISPSDDYEFEEDYENFFALIADRNKNGRKPFSPVIDKSTKEPQAPEVTLKRTVNNTYVFQFIVSSVIDMPMSSVNINEENMKEMVADVDGDHSHFSLEPNAVRSIFDQYHNGYGKVKNGNNYLLSVLNLGNYNCSLLQAALYGFKSKLDLWKNSVYMVSDLKYNDKSEMAKVRGLLGAKPAKLITQDVVFVDRILKAGKTLFALYPEAGGQKTRVVITSFLALDQEYFGNGKKGYLAKKIVNSGLIGCTDGLSGGLPYYSKKLMGNFTQYLKEAQ